MKTNVYLNGRYQGTMDEKRLIDHKMLLDWHDRVLETAYFEARDGKLWIFVKEGEC